MTERLVVSGLRAGYREREVLSGIDLAVPTGRLTVVVGPNACGKSTLLRAMAGQLRPTAGSVELDGRDFAAHRPKEAARLLGMLPQTPVAPNGILVEDLVARGRYPHQGLWRQWSPLDEAAVERALNRAGVADLRDRPLDALSGGQRQRVWIAVALAQETQVLLLDEPTTYLDIAHQVEVLDLCRGLAAEGITVVTVLHELDMAFRYADHVVVMERGEVAAQGRPGEVVTADLIGRVFGLDCQVITDPAAGTPMVVPLVGTSTPL